MEATFRIYRLITLLATLMRHVLVARASATSITAAPERRAPVRASRTSYVTNDIL